MQIIHDFLTVNDYSRPAKKLKDIRAVVLHWTANPKANAKENRDFFESKKTGTGGYASAHYIIEQNGIIYAAVPEDEVAYHTGSSQIDPKSKKIYTDEARKRFGDYASEKSSPNNCTIGVELCPLDNEGHFSDATIAAAVELCADILTRYGLTAKDLTTHHDVVGWKDCPRLWVNKPALFKAFKTSVDDKKKRLKK